VKRQGLATLQEKTVTGFASSAQAPSSRVSQTQAPELNALMGRAILTSSPNVMYTEVNRRWIPSERKQSPQYLTSNHPLDQRPSDTPESTSNEREALQWKGGSRHHQRLDCDRERKPRHESVRHTNANLPGHSSNGENPLPPGGQHLTRHLHDTWAVAPLPGADRASRRSVSLDKTLSPTEHPHFLKPILTRRTEPPPERDRRRRGVEIYR
jgi:hypothetical protein